MIRLPSLYVLLMRRARVISSAIIPISLLLSALLSGLVICLARVYLNEIRQDHANVFIRIKALEMI